MTSFIMRDLGRKLSLNQFVERDRVLLAKPGLRAYFEERPPPDAVNTTVIRLAEFLHVTD